METVKDSTYESEQGEGQVVRPVSSQDLKYIASQVVSGIAKAEADENEKLMSDMLELEDFIMKDTKMIEFRRQLRRKIMIFAGFLLILIAERVLYVNLIMNEQAMLENLQNQLGLTISNDETDFKTFNGNSIFSLFSVAVSFHNIILFFTQISITIFVTFSDFTSIKLVFTTLPGIYFIGVLQLLYDGPVPYWTSLAISTPFCMKTNAHPSLLVFTSLFVSYYFLYCLKARAKRKQIRSSNNNKNQTAGTIVPKSPRWIWYIQIILAIFFPVLFTFIYMSGLNFLMNIGLAFIFFVMYYIVIKKSNDTVNRVIADVSIYPERSKMNIFPWFFYQITLIFFASLVYMSTARFVEIQWIGNYLNCADLQNNFFLNDQLVGPYHTFSEVSSLCGLAGAIFGLSYTYNNLSQSCIKTWFKGPKKMRIIRGVFVNFMMLPSWVLNYYQGDLLRNDFMVNAGLTEFLLDCLHYFLLYLLLFGIIPIHIFQPLNLVYTKHSKNAFAHKLTFIDSAI